MSKTHKIYQDKRQIRQRKINGNIAVVTFDQQIIMFTSKMYGNFPMLVSVLLDILVKFS